VKGLVVVRMLAPAWPGGVTIREVEPSPPPPSPAPSLCPGKSFPSAGVNFGEKGFLTADDGGCDKWVEWAPWWNSACVHTWRGAAVAGNDMGFSSSAAFATSALHREVHRWMQ